jgi:hypothetical protein
MQLRKGMTMSTAITVQLHAETVGRVEVLTIGGDAVSVTFGDDSGCSVRSRTCANWLSRPTASSVAWQSVEHIREVLLGLTARVGRLKASSTTPGWRSTGRAEIALGIFAEPTELREHAARPDGRAPIRLSARQLNRTGTVLAS